MTKVTHTLASSSDTVSVVNGQLLAQHDTGRLFLDYGDSRISITDVLYAAEYPLAPLSDKLYVTPAGARLWHNGTAIDVGGAIDDATITRNSSSQLQAVGLKETNASATQKIWVGTLAEYAAQGKDQSGDLCFITDDEIEDNPNGMPITTIPAATTAYTLEDGVYVHAPTSAPTYTLPDIEDDTVTHTVILMISCATVQTLSFEDEDGNTITPLDTPTLLQGDYAEYLCRYSPLQSSWVISCGLLNS